MRKYPQNEVNNHSKKRRELEANIIREFGLVNPVAYLMYMLRSTIEHDYILISNVSKVCTG